MVLEQPPFLLPYSFHHDDEPCRELLTAVQNDTESGVKTFRVPEKTSGGPHSETGGFLQGQLPFFKQSYWPGLLNCDNPPDVFSTSITKTCCGRGDEMLWFIFLVLLVLWILGLVGTYQIGAWLWLLLVAAVIVLIVQLATGRRVVP